MKNTIVFTAIGLAFLILAGTVVTQTLAKEPTVQERASAELPGVQREIERTQEAADRNQAARLRKDSILKCLSSSNCTDF